MEYLELNAISTFSGIAAILCVAFIRMQWPFRFHAMITWNKKNPEKILHWLDTSYRKNSKRTVAMLDKSTREIIAGNLDLAEKFVAEALTTCTKRPSLFNQTLVHFLFYNLSVIYFYRGKYKDALDVAFRVYHRDHSFKNALGVMVCSHARMGDLQGAAESYSYLLSKRPKEALRLFCLAEIEAAKGDYVRAISHLRMVNALPYSLTLHLNQAEIEKRLHEWTKASSQVS